MGLGIIRQSLLVLGGNVKWLNEEQIRGPRDFASKYCKNR